MEGNRLTLVVLSAGLGRRFGGPKQVEAVGPSGEIILDYSIFDAVRAGFSRIVLVVRDEVEEVLRQHLAPIVSHCEIEYVTQRSDDLPRGHAAPAGRRRPWGTGHAVWTCRDVVTDPFAVVNADDFYGSAAFETMARFLRSGGDSRPLRCAMIGYAVGSTLTPHGSVSRGVCEVDATGRLVSIVERHGVARREGGVGYSEHGTWHPLDESTVASMNFWGFSPSILALFGREFGRFLAARPAAEEEFGLPTVTGTLVGAGDIAVFVLPTTATWLGVTHRHDLEWVHEEIGRRTAAGDYPSPMWEGDT
ncbi:MAG: NTP transferase domain-containing protein [Candidatus Bipolaricaulis sp.]|nr:NTP transferase domain-containing protein [Candidatus Bipolaricaulis sp.]MDD5219300.1 NTP transferase domain-containing protein [Candidatus Bipolaricaulis sp.]